MDRHSVNHQTSVPVEKCGHPGEVEGHRNSLGDDLLSSCVHCGLCLEVCPTYKLTGDENNSPRGRLRLWREEAEGRLEKDSWTDFYTAECVGCLACQSACPANVPYGEIFERVRHEHVKNGRSSPSYVIRAAAQAVKLSRLFDLAMLPARFLRNINLFPHRFVFPGRPSIVQSTASFARQLMEKHKPNGPQVALLTGCLMESLFREINFATVRVLIENNVRVIVPQTQTCCGAFHEHSGIGGIDDLKEKNRTAFSNLDCDVVVCNSSGCGLALSKSLPQSTPVRDVLSFLAELPLVSRKRDDNGTRVYVDLPCHLIHGQKVPGISSKVLDATGYQWSLAPG
ncbi:MAG: (Fe-S)-binding protein, partial [Planctomycetes bacterium]|nr:(Fe-S)-binding protein [Planctomycetota bacterium]